LRHRKNNILERCASQADWRGGQTNRKQEWRLEEVVVGTLLQSHIAAAGQARVKFQKVTASGFGDLALWKSTCLASARP
jgi:hypothetical protein